MKCPVCHHRMRIRVRRDKYLAGVDGHVRNWRLYDCTYCKSLVTLEIPIQATPTNERTTTQT